MKIPAQVGGLPTVLFAELTAEQRETWQWPPYVLPEGKTFQEVFGPGTDPGQLSMRARMEAAVREGVGSFEELFEAVAVAIVGDEQEGYLFYDLNDRGEHYWDTWCGATLDEVLLEIREEYAELDWRWRDSTPLSVRD